MTNLEGSNVAEIDEFQTRCIRVADSARRMFVAGVSRAVDAPLLCFMRYARSLELRNGVFFAKNFEGHMRLIRKGYSLKNLEKLTAMQTPLKKNTSTTLQNNLTTPYAKQLFRNANIVDVENSKLLKRGKMCCLKNGKITSIGNKLKVDESVQVIDAKGKTLAPGLWDMHAHSTKPDGLLNIAAGVTSVRDMGSNHENIMQLDTPFNSSQLIAPRLYRAGFMDQESHYSAGLSVKSLEEAVKTVHWFADNDYLQVKLYSSIDPAWVKPIAARAHHRGMRVSGHVPAFMTAEQAINSGYGEIQHINMLYLNFLAGSKFDTRKQLRFSLVGEKASTLNLQSKEVQTFIKLLADK